MGVNKGRHLDTPRKIKITLESYGPNMKQLAYHRTGDHCPWKISEIDSKQ